MIRLKTQFKDVSADALYDVLHDPVYRKVSTSIEVSVTNVLHNPVYVKESSRMFLANPLSSELS